MDPQTIMLVILKFTERFIILFIDQQRCCSYHCVNLITKGKQSVMDRSFVILFSFYGAVSDLIIKGLILLEI